VSGEPAFAVRSHLLVVVFRQCPSSAKHNVAHWLFRENNSHTFPYDVKVMLGKYLTELYCTLKTSYSHTESISPGNVTGLSLNGGIKDIGGG